MSAPDRGARSGIARDIAVVALAALVAVAAVITAALGATESLVLGLGGIAAVLLAMRLPGVMLGLYFLIPLFKGSLQPYSPIDLTILLAMANATQLVPLVLEHRRREISFAGLALWGLFGLLVLAGILWAPDAGAATGRTVTAALLLFVPVVPAAIRVGGDERFLRQLVGTFIVAGAVTVALGVAALSSSERLVVFDTNTIETARAALLFPLLAMLFVPQQPSPLIRYAALAFGVVAVVVALASGSRGPVMAILAIGAVGLIWRLATSRGPGARTLIGTALLAAIGVAIVASGSIDLPVVSTDRFASFGDFLTSFTGGSGAAGIDDDSAGARVVLFDFAIDLFRSSPFIGVGTGGYSALSPAALGEFEANAYPHNVILQVAAEYGLLGIGIVIALIVLALLRPLPVHSYGHAVRLLFVFFLLNSMVSGDLFDERATWGLAMLLLLIDVAPRPAGREARGEAGLPRAWPLAPVGPPGPYAIPAAPTPSDRARHRRADALWPDRRS